MGLPKAGPRKTIPAGRAGKVPAQKKGPGPPGPWPSFLRGSRPHGSGPRGFPGAPVPGAGDPPAHHRTRWGKAVGVCRRRNSKGTPLPFQIPPMFPRRTREGLAKGRGTEVHRPPKSWGKSGRCQLSKPFWDQGARPGASPALLGENGPTARPAPLLAPRWGTAAKPGCLNPSRPTMTRAIPVLHRIQSPIPRFSIIANAYYSGLGIYLLAFSTQPRQTGGR